VSLTPPIEHDLAEKALKADVRNALTDVAQGQLLPPSKRDLLFGVMVSDANSQEVWEAHVASLLKKFAKGGRLTSEEMERIAHLLPPDLAPFSKRLARAAYQRTYAEHAAIYSKSVRTIKWWVGEGKKAEGGPDLPPLDDPTQMPLWWDRVMENKCPESVRDAALKAAGGSPAAAVKPSTNGSVPPPSAGAPSRAYTIPIDATINDDRLSQLKEQLSRARFLLLEAQNEDPPDAGKIETREKKWRELRREVDDAEEAAFKLRSKQGKMVDLDDIAARLMPKLITCRDSLRSLCARVRPKLTADQSPVEQDEIWNAAIDECFAELITNGFAPGFKLAA